MRARERGQGRMADDEWWVAFRHAPFAIRGVALGLCAPLCALALAACSGPGLDDSRAGLSCVDDTPQCIERRQMTLRHLLSDKERRWVKEAPTPQAHASGVRLFAFRSAKGELTCDELVHGRREAEAAPRALRSESGLSPAQISRASLFAGEVARELTAEIRRRRCRV
jgi:hypothetical protein